MENNSAGSGSQKKAGSRRSSKKRESLNSEAASITSPTASQMSRPKMLRTLRPRDPVKAQRKMDKKLQRKEKVVPPSQETSYDGRILPDLRTRIELGRTSEPDVDAEPVRTPYVAPVSRKQKKAKKERRQKEEEERNFCKYEVIKLPRPVIMAASSVNLEVPSPDVSDATVTPRRPSPSPSAGWPEPQTESELELQKPKSGIFINETTLATIKEDEDSFNLLYERKPRRYSTGSKRKGSLDEGKKKRKKKKKKQSIQGEGDAEEKTSKAPGSPEITAIMDEEERYLAQIGEDDNVGAIESDTFLTKAFRRKVSQASKATSINDREFFDLASSVEESLVEESPYITRLIQKFRRDSECAKETPKARKIKRGTLESHSFTKLKQVTLKDFFFGTVAGSIHQGDESFSASSRDRQGVCMPVAAYCTAILKHPCHWTREVIDKILEAGDKLYHDSTGKLHIHEHKTELLVADLYKYCVIGTKRMHFTIHEPEIAGLLKSTEKTIYNLTKGLKIFFKRCKACVLQTVGLDVLIWKDKSFYIFDAKPRRKDLQRDLQGVALLGHVYDLPAVVTILLEKSELGNWPFTLSKIAVPKIGDVNLAEEEEEESVNVTYNTINDRKAVVQGSFDLADRCFDFSRNKQSLAMAAVALVYTKITPSAAWNRRTIDKIMIIGNQLYLECVEETGINEMQLEDLPAVFTIGPYVVDISMYARLHVDLMFRKGECMFKTHLDEFFKKKCNGIVQIGKMALAIWKQRNFFYCFDPYSRNNVGLVCRSGTACVSMFHDVETMVETVVTNFTEKDAFFYLHALKVLQIHRDPVQAQMFPKTMTMNDIAQDSFKKYKMRKTKRAATDKSVTADFSETAAQSLQVGESPEPSLIKVESTVDSLAPEILPPMRRCVISKALKTKILNSNIVVDLDSPSLSDTQIDPPRPVPSKTIQPVEMVDLDSFELTQEELELQGSGEGEDVQAEAASEKKDGSGDYEDQAEEGAESEDAYYIAHQITQIGSHSLDSHHSFRSVEVNTMGYFPITLQVLPQTDIRPKIRARKVLEMTRKQEDFLERTEHPFTHVTQSQELAKESNFVDVPDDTQLVRGTKNISEFGKQLDYMAPFVCMMASAMGQKYTVLSWSTDIVDYVLKTGAELYNISKVRYDQVPCLDIPKIRLGKSEISISVKYLFDSYMKQSVLEMALERILFPKCECGLVVTPSYACTVFLKNHLFYMFDGFGCNEVGLGEGPSNSGVAAFARFKNIHTLASRIMYNKSKREDAEDFEFSKFVLSSCKSRPVPPPEERKKKRDKRGKAVDEVDDDEKSDEEERDEGGEDEAPPSPPSEKKTAPKKKSEDQVEKEPEPENRVGYQNKKGVYTIQGSKALGGGDSVAEELKEDHFVCLCACLMLVNCPVDKWDTKKVDYVLEQGAHVYSHADNLELAGKRTIKNVLINKHLFDIVVKKLAFYDATTNKSFDAGLTTVMRKRQYCLIQFPNCCLVLYEYKNKYHLFDAYGCMAKAKNKKKSKKKAYSASESNGGWTLFKDINKAKKRIKARMVDNGRGGYNFYIFEVTSIRKAPKQAALGQRMMVYELDKPRSMEMIGKPLHERESWLDLEPLPWSRRQHLTASGVDRGQKGTAWHNWETEYPNDLYSLLGTHHQTDSVFTLEARGKQTLSNLVVAIAMLEIYKLSEWTPAIMDSILVNGDNYFKECIKDIEEEDHELTMEDLKQNSEIFPYKFEVSFKPVVEGTLFLLRTKQFNLYKALRFFFENYDVRFGIICGIRGEHRRFLAFGKTQDSEYFMYDCQAYGPPMFLARNGVAYILRSTSFKRLLHVLVMTLKMGDFYIYEVETTDFKPMV